MANKVIGTTKANIPVQADADMQNLVDAVVADEEGNVEVGRNLHVDGAILSEGGLIANGVSDLGDAEGDVITNVDTNVSFAPKVNGHRIFIFGTSFVKINCLFYIAATIAPGTVMFKFNDAYLHDQMVNNGLKLRAADNTGGLYDFTAAGTDEIDISPLGSVSASTRLMTEVAIY